MQPLCVCPARRTSNLLDNNHDILITIAKAPPLTIGPNSASHLNKSRRTSATNDRHPREPTDDQGERPRPSAASSAGLREPDRASRRPNRLDESAIGLATRCATTSRVHFRRANPNNWPIITSQRNQQRSLPKLCTGSSRQSQADKFDTNLNRHSIDAAKSLQLDRVRFEWCYEQLIVR